MFTGCGTELFTPVDVGQQVDERVYRNLIRDQVHAEAEFLVACGAIQDWLSLTCAEQLQLVSIAVEAARRRVPVVAGMGGLPLAAALDHAKHLESLRVAGLLLTAADREMRSQRELQGYALAIADAVSLPVTLTNDPARTGVHWEPQTLSRLAQIDNIVGVLERSGSISVLFETLQQVPDNFIILSGDDRMMVTRMAMGARGAVSSMANRIPREMRFLVELCQHGDLIAAAEFYQRCLPLTEPLHDVSRARPQTSYLQ